MKRLILASSGAPVMIAWWQDFECSAQVGRRLLMFSRFVRISQRRFLIAKIVLLLSLLGSPSVYAGDLVKLTVVNTCNCAILSAGHEAVVQIGESAKPFNLPVGGKQVLELSKGTYLFTVSVKGHKTIRQNIYLNEDGFVEIDSVGSISLEFKKFGTETW